MRTATALGFAALATIAGVFIFSSWFLTGPGSSMGALWILALVIGAGCFFWTLRGSATSLDVARKGFLFGVLEWALGFVVLLIGGGVAGVMANPSSEFAGVGGMLGGGMLGCLGLLFALVSLMGYFATSRMARERSISNVKACPRCGETVQAAAQMCRFCGFSFAPPPAMPPQL